MAILYGGTLSLLGSRMILSPEKVVTFSPCGGEGGIVRSDGPSATSVALALTLAQPGDCSCQVLVQRTQPGQGDVPGAQENAGQAGTADGH